MLAAVLIIMGEIGSPCDTQWLRNRLVAVKVPSLSRKEARNPQ
jgi:hypothetical protein